MQIDFHHAVTYVVARMAGFTHANANIVAYSAQYVDDSITDGFIEFGNGMRYRRFATAHPTKDIQNVTNNNENAQSWQPFHFLPGNAGQAADADTTGISYEDRLICLPDSPVAKAMMASVIATRNAPWGLHRLGLASHVFADTFAHQEFVGLNHSLNDVNDDIQTFSGEPLKRLPLPPVGHAKVDTYPDRPYLAWTYTKGNGKSVKRDNTEIFTTAATRMFEEFKRFQAGEATAVVPQIPEPDQKALAEMFSSLVTDKEKDRHDKWLEAIEAGHFSFGKAPLKYDGSGTDSWKSCALGQSYIEGLANRIKEATHDEVGISVNIKADNAGVFLESDYKRFHDAVRMHRHQMLTEVFPSFGLHIG
ncbi:MAG: hypothetical protein PHD65_02440 [Gallionella sp.]|nr:hypothetical protein [Gallionella sp.]